MSIILIIIKNKYFDWRHVTYNCIYKSCWVFTLSRRLKLHMLQKTIILQFLHNYDGGEDEPVFPENLFQAGSALIFSVNSFLPLLFTRRRNYILIQGKLAELSTVLAAEIRCPFFIRLYQPAFHACPQFLAGLWHHKRLLSAQKILRLLIFCRHSLLFLSFLDFYGIVLHLIVTNI